MSATWSFEKASVEVVNSKGFGDERAAAFSAARAERGRLFGRSEDCDVGRLCHERGVRAGAFSFEGEAEGAPVRLPAGS
jgi:hypothetical protein